MTGTYEKGQRVLVEPVKNRELSPRDSTLESYRGEIGTIVDVHWLNMGASARNIYIYTVRIDNEGKEIVLHEDELKVYME